MAIEFRKRTPAEYLQILRRHKLMILLPALSIAFAVGYVVWKLPSIYESRSLLVMSPPKISGDIVKRLADTELLMRLNAIRQVVTSRSTLEPLIVKYKLYERERARGVPVEVLIEQMQMKDIFIQLDNTREDNGFLVKFQGSDPRATQAVTAELAGRFVSAQNTQAMDNSMATRQLFENQVNEQKAKLDAIDQRRFNVMRSNADNLPSAMGSLTSQLEGLRQQQTALTTEIGRLGDRRTQLNNALITSRSAREDAIAQVDDPINDPTKSVAYGQLISKQSNLKTDLQTLLATLRPKHPDVIAKQNEIADVAGDLKAMTDDYNRRVEARRNRLSNSTDVNAAQIRSEMQFNESETRRMQSLLGQLGGQISIVESKLNGVPGATVALEAVDREYNTEKSIYDEFLKRKGEADLAATVATNSQGESIQVIDPANLPVRPVAPNRPLFIAIGLLFGLAIGVLLAMLRELPRFSTVQTTADAEHYTGLPVLVSMPEILTTTEVRNRRLRQAMFAAVGVAAAVIAVPALILVFRATRIFELLTGVS